MSPETQLRTPPGRSKMPDLDAEQEVDFGRAWSSLAERWWLPLGGLVAGIIVGYLLSLGGTQTYRAQSIVSVGTPLAVGGGILPSVQTNPSAVRQVALAEVNIRRAAAVSGLRPGRLRGAVSANPIAAAVGTKSTGQTPLYAITVKGPAPRKVAVAANELAQIVVTTISAEYVDAKIKTLRDQVRDDQRELADLNKRLAQEQALLGSLSPAEKLSAVSIIQIGESRRATLTQDQLSARPLLAQAETVEKGRILTRASATKVTARSTRNSVLVGAFIGLILGVLAALLWAPVATRVGRRPAV